MQGHEPPGAPPPQTQGLRAPHGALVLLQRLSARRAPRLVAQTLGFVIGLALLWWCIHKAFGPQSRGELAGLRHAPLGPALGLIGLAALSVIANGVAFWGTLLPLRRLRLVDVVAVNAVSSFLAFLPFKLGALFRVAAHRKRDRLPMRDIVAWLAAFAAISLATLAPMLGALLVLGRADALWGAISLLGAAGVVGVGVALGRLSERTPWLARLSLGSWRVVRSPTPGLWCSGAKIADVAIQAGRFLLAAQLLGVDMRTDHAFAASILYYVLGSASPVGMLGVRESGVVFFGVGESRESLARLVLTLSATEAATFAALALVGGAWLAWTKPPAHDPITP